MIGTPAPPRTRDGRVRTRARSRRCSTAPASRSTTTTGCSSPTAAGGRSTSWTCGAGGCCAASRSRRPPPPPGRRSASPRAAGTSSPSSRTHPGYSASAPAGGPPSCPCRPRTAARRPRRAGWRSPRPGGTVTLWATPAGAAWLVAGGRPRSRSTARASWSRAPTARPWCWPRAPRTGTGRHRCTGCCSTATGWVRAQPLDARGYDGRGLVALEGGRIGYWSASGLRLAVAGRVRVRTGRHLAQLPVRQRHARKPLGPRLRRRLRPDRVRSSASPR